MLEQLLAINIFHFLLIFARLSVVFAMMPGVSAGYMPTRFRVLIALLVTVIMLPLLKDQLPAQPETSAELVWMIGAEVLIGGFLGAIIQILMSALETAGEMISNAAGLTNAFVDDLVSEEQTAIVVGLLNILAVVLIFATGAHQLFFSAVIDSYSLIRPGGELMAGDGLNLLSMLLVQAFYMGIKLAAPFLVFEIIFQVANGVLARLSPQLNVFFVALPLQNLIGFAILFISLPTLMLIFIGFFENHLENLLVPVGGNG
ncbi:MAG: flagellar biosynthetic protein FliR [Alphaproteobacteria bacterium]|nr:flagellar biosynthetic protein FliR [Alphaproteobacteria bacterium]